MHYSLKISWLYPEFMNIYGDRGNILTLQKRCSWRKINTDMKYLEIGFDENEILDSDIILMGGAQDIQQQIVETDLNRKKEALKKAVHGGIAGLYVCGAYQFMGSYYKDSQGKTIEGLGIFDLHTINPGEKHKRLIGNLTTRINLPTKSPLRTLVGFENHGGRTYLGPKIQQLAYVLNGYGNNGDDKTEGAILNNSIGTYMHGPILPKNPHLADFLIEKALKRKYKNFILKPLDDIMELKAHKKIAKRMGVGI